MQTITDVGGPAQPLLTIKGLVAAKAKAAQK